MVCAKYNSRKTLAQFAYHYTQLHMNEEYTDVSYLAMFCTLIRREIIEKHGFLDPQYKVGMFEDDDYAEVVKKAGYSFVIAEDVFVHHVNNASLSKLDNEEYRKIFEHNKELFEKKWGRKWVMPKYREGITPDTNKECKLPPESI